ncbi:MAG: hypothetical protein WCC57_04820 [Paracoccaceae bacterium]
MTPIKTILLTTLTCLFGTLSAAQDAELYEGVADPSSSFVRVIVSGQTMANVDGVSFDGLETGVTPYVMIEKPGDVQISAGEENTTQTIVASTYYTYLVGADGVGTMLTDAITNSPAQADVTFYNLSDVPSIDLFVPAAKAVAIPAVAANQTGSVALKAPLKLEFEIKQGDAVLASVPAVDLKRRAGIAIVFRGTNGSYEAAVTENVVVN